MSDVVPVPAPALLINITRGPFIESRHFVHALLMDGAGRIRAQHGDAARLTFPRSTLKPLQALPLLESGAAEAYNLSDEEVALACASHNGDEMHVAAVAAWLDRLGLDETALECGVQSPRMSATHGATALCNNCSGKHAGMLTLALFTKAATKGYTQVTHPVQQEILKRIGELCGTRLTPDVCGIDGCSAPNPAMPLTSLARGFATLMKQETPSGRRIYKAMTQHADYVSGAGRLDTVLMKTANGKILSKTGAEGAYIVLIPAQDTVIALKAEDGATRAAQAALHLLLDKYKLADSAVLEAIAPLTLPTIRNWRGLETGHTSF